MREFRLTRRELLKGLVAAGVSTVFLGACQPKAAPTSSPEAKPAPTDTAPPEPTATLREELAKIEAALEVKELEGFVPKRANPDEEIVILYWWGNNYEPSLEYCRTFFKKFSLAYPNVTIKDVPGQDCDAFVAAAAAGTPPELFHTWDCAERMGLWAHRGMIIPIDDYIEADDYDLDDIIPGLMESCTWEGKIWGLIESAGLFLFWMRTPVVAEIGKGPDDVPKDTDEVWAWAKELTTRDKDGNIEQLGMSVPSWAWDIFVWTSNFGGSLFDPQSGDPTPDHPGVITALEDMVEQINFYGLEDMQRWQSSIGSQGGEQNPWLQGTMPLQISGDWGGQAIFDFFPDWKVGVDYTVVAPPPAPASKLQGAAKVNYWCWPWVIPSGTKYPEWAWESLRYMTSPGYMINVRAKFKESTVFKSMLDDERIWWPAAKASQRIIKSDVEKTPVFPMSAVAGQYYTLLSEAFDEINNLAISPEEAMVRVKKETMEALAEVMEG